MIGLAIGITGIALTVAGVSLGLTLDQLRSQRRRVTSMTFACPGRFARAKTSPRKTESDPGWARTCATSFRRPMWIVQTASPRRRDGPGRGFESTESGGVQTVALIALASRIEAAEWVDPCLEIAQRCGPPESLSLRSRLQFSDWD